MCLYRIVPIETGSTSHGPSTVAFKVQQFLLKLLFHGHVLGRVQSRLHHIFVSVPLPAYLASSKRQRHNENAPLPFVDQSTPVPKRPRLKAVDVSGEILAEEGHWLTKYLQPGKNQTTSELLVQFSLERIMSESECIAPTLCQLLRGIATKQQLEEREKVRKDRSLVSL